MWKRLCKALGTSGEAYNVADEESDITLKELIAMLRQRPEEVLGMFSEALSILD